VALLNSQIEKGIELLAKPFISQEDLERWEYVTRDFLVKTFGHPNARIDRFDIPRHTVPPGTGMTESGWEDLRRKNLSSKLKVLQSYVEILEGELLTEETQPEAQAVTAHASEPDSITELRRIFSRFHLISRRLRIRHAGRSTIEIHDEYDVQDLLHGLLTLYFDDVRPEEWVPSYAGCSSRMDFLLKQEKVVVEVKMTRKGLGGKQVADQLIVDIARYYKGHPDCERLVCFVYDPDGRITNPTAIENDLSKRDGKPDVDVIIVPKNI